MSAGLDASTVTPGNTAPEASFTTPTIDAWAKTAVGTSTNTARTRIPFNTRCMFLPLRLRVQFRTAVLPGILTAEEIHFMECLRLIRYSGKKLEVAQLDRKVRP